MSRTPAFVHNHLHAGGLARESTPREEAEAGDGGGGEDFEWAWCTAVVD